MTVARITAHPQDIDGRTTPASPVYIVNQDGSPIATGTVDGAGFATEAGQESAQTTLEAILAKITASAATAAKQDQIITLLTATNALLTTIAANTTPA